MHLRIQTCVLCLIVIVMLPELLAAHAQGAPGSTNYQSPVIAYIGPTGDVNVTSMGINPGSVRLTGDARRRPDSETPFYTQDVYYTAPIWSPDGNNLVFSTLNGRLFI